MDPQKSINPATPGEAKTAPLPADATLADPTTSVTNDSNTSTNEPAADTSGFAGASAPFENVTPTPEKSALEPNMSPYTASVMPAADQTINIAPEAPTPTELPSAVPESNVDFSADVSLSPESAGEIPVGPTPTSSAAAPVATETSIASALEAVKAADTSTVASSDPLASAAVVSPVEPASAIEPPSLTVTPPASAMPSAQAFTADASSVPATVIVPMPHGDKKIVYTQSGIAAVLLIAIVTLWVV